MRVDFGELYDTGKAVVKEALDDDLTGLASELAYRFMLALFPFFIFVAALGGFMASWLSIQNPTQEVMDQLQGHLPEDAASVIEGQLESVLNSRNGGLLSFGILGALAASSAAMNTLIKAFNRVYDVEESRPIYVKMPMSFALTLLAAVAFIGGFAIIVAGQLYADDIGGWFGVGELAAAFVNLARFPLVGLMILVAMAFLYWALPNIDIPFRWVTPGAVFFVLAWLIATFAFGFYVSNFGSYNETYGTLGGVIVLMIWLYLTGLVMVIGAEINALVQGTIVPEKLTGPLAEEGIIGQKRKEAGAAGSKTEDEARDKRRERKRQPPDGRRERLPAPVGSGTLALGAVIGAIAAWRGLRLAATRRQPEGPPSSRTPRAPAGGR